MRFPDDGLQSRRFLIKLHNSSHTQKAFYIILGRCSSARINKSNILFLSQLSHSDGGMETIFLFTSENLNVQLSSPFGGNSVFWLFLASSINWRMEREGLYNFPFSSNIFSSEHETLSQKQRKRAKKLCEEFFRSESKFYIVFFSHKVFTNSFRFFSFLPCCSPSK